MENNNTHSFCLRPVRAISFAVAALAACPASACSVCIAHALGSGVQAIGAQTLHPHSFVAGITFSTFHKSQDGETPGTEESHFQAEYNLHLAYALEAGWMLRADVPYVIKRLGMTGEDPVDTNGLGDITLGATYQFEPRATDKVLLAFSVDAKLPTGRNNLKDALGDRLEEHSQLGTGSTDFTIGLLATMEAGDGLAFGRLAGRFNGRNGEGYRYGSVLYYNLGYSQPLAGDSSLVFEWNGRIADKDQNNGADDENSGGHLAYLSLSYRSAIGASSGLAVTYQIPFIKQLNGSQSESPLFSIGLFYRF